MAAGAVTPTTPTIAEIAMIQPAIVVEPVFRQKLQAVNAKKSTCNAAKIRRSLRDGFHGMETRAMFVRYLRGVGCRCRLRSASDELLIEFKFCQILRHFIGWPC